MSTTVFRTPSLQRFLQGVHTPNINTCSTSSPPQPPAADPEPGAATGPSHNLQRTPSRALRLSSGAQAGRCDKTFSQPAADPTPGAAPLQRTPSRELRHNLPATCSGRHAGRCDSQAQPSSRQRPGPRALHPEPPCPPSRPPCLPAWAPVPSIRASVPSIRALSPTSGPPCPFQAADLKLVHSGV